MVEVLNPRSARDFFVRIVHVASAQNAADGHYCDEVARHGWNARAVPGHQPKLWEHCNSSDKEAAHPESVKDRPLIEITMEHNGEDEAAEYQGCHRKGISVNL